MTSLDLSFRGGLSNQFDVLQRFYTRLAPAYDRIFGRMLDAGRRAGVRGLTLTPGAKVLEVGIGTALTAPLYPSHCRVVGVDISEPMLRIAQHRINASGLAHVSVHRMNAAHLGFPDECFDVAYAAYVISTVSDPTRVLTEIARVCRPGGRVVILNRFKSPTPWLARIEAVLSPVTSYCGFRAGLDLDLIAASGLRIVQISRVNAPPLWSLVTCEKPS